MIDRKYFFVFKLILFILFLILFLQLSNIQIIKSNYLKRLAKENRIRVIKEEPPRGLIYDRNKNILVKNNYKLNVAVLPHNSIRTKKIASLVNIPYSELKEKLTANSNYYQPIVIKENVTIEEVVKLEQDLSLKGIIVEHCPIRFYLNDRLAAHILGYVRPITKEKYRILKEVGYEIDDVIGMDGVEEYYDKILRGTKGGKQIEVDAKGNLVRILGKKKAIQGKSIILTIDKDLQQFCEYKLQGNRGVIIVINPQNFEILSLVSMPNFAPGFFQNKITNQEWNYLIHSSGKPLQNRAIANKYPPGSVFKLITAVSALQEGIIDKDTKFYCKGHYEVGNRIFKCWTRHGELDIIKAIAHSCDVVFYQLSEKLGIEKIRKYASLFGIGKKTGIDLPSEIEGFLPSKEWKKITFREGWYLGDTLNLGIGQGFLAVTPIQVAKMVSIIANDGKEGIPHLLKTKIIDEDVNKLKYKMEKIPISSSTLRIIKEGMIGAVEGGTGINAKSKYISIAGKTGTAEGKKGEIPHAWFVAFAPLDNPQICVVVFIENGGKGGEVAAPIAKEIIEYYFKKFRG